MRTDVEDMERHIIDLTGDVEDLKDQVNYWKKESDAWRTEFFESSEAHCKTRTELTEVRDRISRAIDAIALTDKTREGISILRVARVRNADRLDKAVV